MAVTQMSGRIARASAITYAVAAGLNGLFWSVIGGMWAYAGYFGGAPSGGAVL